MGGSSFLFTCAAIGIVLSVARNVEQTEGKAPLETGVAAADVDAAGLGNLASAAATTNPFTSQKNIRPNV
jgi:cell division protein FtsW